MATSAQLSTCSRRVSGSLQQEHQSRAKWTDGLTRILVELMVDQVHKGNKGKKGFGKKPWKNMCDEFLKLTGLAWDKEQLKNRYSVLRKQYSVVKCLLDNENFSWDEATGAVLATDNEVWDEYIREHPDAETVRSSGCPIYKQLCTVFSEAPTNGKCGDSTEYSDADPFGFLCTTEPLSILTKSSSESEEETEMADEQEKFQPVRPNSTGSRKRGRKGNDDAIANAILEMAAASKLRAAAAQQHGARFSIANCVKGLDEMQGLDERTYFAALNLFDNPDAREIFMSLNVDKRLIWLYRKCTNAPSSSTGC